MRVDDVDDGICQERERERGTIPHVQGGTRLSPCPPCNDPRASARGPGRVFHHRMSPLQIYVRPWMTTRCGIAAHVVCALMLQLFGNMYCGQVMEARALTRRSRFSSYHPV